MTYVLMKGLRRVKGTVDYSTLDDAVQAQKEHGGTVCRVDWDKRYDAKYGMVERQVLRRVF